jgi:DNA-binding MarR family transcriptional regulator
MNASIETESAASLASPEVEESEKLPVHRIYQMPGHLVRRLHQIAVALFTEHTKEFGVTPVQYASLAVAESYPGIDQRRLANAIAFDRSTIGDVVQRLDQRGWLRRENGNEDRRTKSVFITDSGREVLKQLDESVADSQAKILAPLSEGERAIFMFLLSKLVQLSNTTSRSPLRAFDEGSDALGTTGAVAPSAARTAD